MMISNKAVNPSSTITKNASLLPQLKKRMPTKTCLACGTAVINARRRYCSRECRQKMMWVLSLSTGLLKVFNARYAAFSFTKNHVILDVLPAWAKEISRFTNRRVSGSKPAEDLKRLILESGCKWYSIVDNNSKSYASLSLLNEKHCKKLTLDNIKPNNTLRPRFSKDERASMKILQLKMEELISDGKASKIRSSYKKLAKIYHPDVGGDAEKFKRLNEAHQQMLSWSENPQFTSRKALLDCWSYDGSTNKWSPPL
ncbi:MAG: DnaJ domain-containing protein [Deltaproteobacteria bacterium]|nr:DnaJ domain-containing protein [Deltaproteobacteria bacterium]